MNQIIIISPDPETARILGLRLEIEGYLTTTVIDVGHALRTAKTHNSALIILDMIDNSRSQWGEVHQLSRGKMPKDCSVALILPRGYLQARLKETRGKPDLIIKRPYEMEVFVEEVNSLLSTPKKSSSSRRNPRRPF